MKPRFLGAARWAACLCIVSVIAACGGGGGGETGGNNGGGNNPGGGSNPPGPVAPLADLSGEWSITESGVSDCPGEETFTDGPYSVAVTQAGNDLSVVTPAGTFTGTISGNEVAWTGSYPEEGGTVSIDTMTLIVSTDGNSLSGSSRWSWSDGINACSGTTQSINGTRVPGTGAAPDAPTDLIAIEQSDSSISLSWNAGSTEQTGFKIERSLDAATGFEQIALTPATETSYVSIGLNPSSLYYFRIRAYNDNGDSDYSAVASATTLGAPVDAPAAPSDLMAVSTTTDAIELSWLDNSNDETGFELERSTNASTGFALAATIPADLGTYTDADLESATTYYYRLRATSPSGNSAYSNTANGTTQAASTAPPAPTGLQAALLSPTSIFLNWADNSNDETGFKVERSTFSSTGFTQIATTPANATGFADGALAASTTYYYRVRATRSDVTPELDSAFSDVANATTPTPTPVLSGPAISNDGNIRLMWTFDWPGLVSNQDGYQAQVSDLSATEGFTHLFSTAFLGVADTESPKTLETFKPDPGTYHYRVRAIVAGAPTDWSNVVSVQVTAPAARTLRIVNDLADTVAGPNDWGRMNKIIRVRIGTSENAILTNTALERLWPLDSAPADSTTALSYVIDPYFDQPTSYRDFDVDQFTSGTYWVYLQTGWWELFFDPFSGAQSWEKHMTQVVGCNENDTVYKWATFQVTGHQSGTFEVQASQFLPIGNFFGTEYCR